MLSVADQQRIYLAAEPVDMRGGFDRLAGRVKQAGLDLYAGHLFVFMSKRRTHLKVLTWDGTGMVVFYKRLGRGKFVPAIATNGQRPATLDPAAFAILLRGAETLGVRRSKSATQTRSGLDPDGRT